MKFPFEPKSTARMEPGQFWAIPLRSGRFAAGIVLALARRQGKRDSRMACVGLLDWVGESCPTGEALSAAKLIEHGFAHVRCIQCHGKLILGNVERDFGFEPELDFDRLAGAGIPVWGYSWIHNRAELRWGDAAWVKQELSDQWASLVNSKAGA